MAEKTLSAGVTAEAGENQTFLTIQLDNSDHMDVFVFCRRFLTANKQSQLFAKNSSSIVTTLKVLCVVHGINEMCGHTSRFTAGTLTTK